MVDKTYGFDAVQVQINQLSSSIKDIACLIDSHSEQSTEVELHTGGRIVPGINMPKDASDLYTLAKNIDEGLFTIVVLGTFKNGKSTLLNAMLGDKQLPAGAAPTTGVITLLVFGDDDLVEIYEYDRNEPRRLSREDFFDEYRLQTDDADELKEFRFQNVRFARMTTRHRICELGVRLVDSPGLGEHSSRSELTQSFLYECQAVIMVLDANHLLGLEERDFIDKYIAEKRQGENRLEHAFFVVNRINQVDEDEIPELHRRARNILGKYFSDEQGKIDEDLYNKRIFWVDAKSGLAARKTQPLDIASLTRSGIPHFEENLEQFLTNEQMFRALTFRSTQVVSQAVRNAYAYIQGKKKTITEPLNELEKRRVSVSEKLDELQRRFEDIDLLISKTGETVRYRLEIDLNRFVDQMSRDTKKDAASVTKDLGDVSFSDVALSGLSRERREKIGRTAKKAIEKYVRGKFEIWSEQATTLINKDVDALREELKERVTEFAVRLNEIRREFSGEEAIYGSETQELGVKITTTIFAGGTGWEGILGGTLRRLMLVILVMSIGTLTPIGWALLVILFIVDARRITKSEKEFKEKLLERMIEKVQENLRSDLMSQDFSPANFTRLAEFLSLLKDHKNPLDLFIWRHLSDETKKQIEKFRKPDKAEESPALDEIAKLLATDLTEITKTQHLYLEKRLFNGINLPDETARLRDAMLSNESLQKSDLPPGDEVGNEIGQLNRYMIVDAYADFLAPKVNDVIQRNVKAQFVKVSNDLTTELKAQIDQIRAQIDATIEEMKQEEFSVEQEKIRLDRIAEKLFEILNIISSLSGRPTYENFEELMG